MQIYFIINFKDLMLNLKKLILIIQLLFNIDIKIRASRGMNHSCNDNVIGVDARQTKSETIRRV